MGRGWQWNPSMKVRRRLIALLQARNDDCIDQGGGSGVVEEGRALQHLLETS